MAHSHFDKVKQPVVGGVTCRIWGNNVFQTQIDIPDATNTILQGIVGDTLQ